MFVDFELAEKKPKTAVYRIVSKSRGETLGSIYWYGPWRQYIFQPEPETVWSRGCMQQVFDFIQKLMQERKEKMKRGRPARLDCRAHNSDVAGSNPAPATIDDASALVVYFCIWKERVERIYEKLRKSKLGFEDKVWILAVTSEPLPQIKGRRRTINV